MQFKDIVGQQDVANRLTEIIDSGRVSHAQLILGRTAEGSMQLALAYLQYLCCEHRVHHAEGGLRADSCGTCPQCKKIGSLMHPDLHFVFPNPPNGSQSVSSDDYMAQYLDFLKEYKGLGTLEEFNASLAGEVKTSIIRESDAANIVRTLGLKSYEGGWKMLVVWLPERMNASAANELLKTLEEPSEHTLILLVSEDAEHLLPTIRSRVQTVRLPVSDERPGMEMTDQFGPMMVGWLRQLFKLKMKELAEQVETLAKMDRPQLKLFLRYTLGVMRECFLHSAAGKEVVIGSGDAKFDAMFPGMVTANNIETINDALSDALFAVDRNANAKIALMELSFRMSKALKKR